MSATVTPAPKTNHIGLTMIDYRGGKTTLCAGCGHNAISERIIDAMYEMGVRPENIAKLSGIGCSSKSPAYFVNRAHGFNSVHGRMPSVATGVALANRKLMVLGVTGDGDTASIGIGQFVHLMRRNLPIIYVIEDNGVYGLTKGQFSATADLGSKLKTGVINDLPPIDTCALAIQLGATFVARSFSGDKRQLLYKYSKDHEEPVQEVGFVPSFENIEVDYDPGTTTTVRMHDGSELRLRKLDRDYDATSKVAALHLLAESHEKGEMLTGVFYVNTKAPNFIEMLNMTDQSLATLPQDVTRPSKTALDEIMESLR